MRAPADAKMAVDSALASDRDEVFDCRRSGDADLRGEKTLTSDFDVMGDLHEVIDFRAAADDGVTAAATVDRGVGPDLDIVSDDDPA